MRLIKKTTNYIKGKNPKVVKEKIRDKITNILEIPKEVIGDTLKISVIDNSYVLIEGSSKILDYYDHYIKLKTNKYNLTIDGKNLNIQEISDSDLIITGNVLNISYI